MEANDRSRLDMCNWANKVLETKSNAFQVKSMDVAGIIRIMCSSAMKVMFVDCIQAFYLMMVEMTWSNRSYD